MEDSLRELQGPEAEVDPKKYWELTSLEKFSEAFKGMEDFTLKGTPVQRVDKVKIISGEYGDGKKIGMRKYIVGINLRWDSTILYDSVNI